MENRVSRVDKWLIVLTFLILVMIVSLFVFSWLDYWPTWLGF